MIEPGPDEWTAINGVRVAHDALPLLPYSLRKVGLGLHPRIRVKARRGVDHQVAATSVELILRSEKGRL